MGYACPVCGDPQADAGHLANHLAFTAMIRDDGHEAWLDEHAPGWSDRGEEELAEQLHGHDELETADYPQVFEDTTDETRRDDPASERSGALFDEDGGAGHSHDHAGNAGNTGHGGAGGEFPDAVSVDPASEDLSDEERAEILAEARELTRRMYEEDDEDTAAEDATSENAAADGTVSRDDEGANGGA